MRRALLLVVCLALSACHHPKEVTRLTALRSERGCPLNADYARAEHRGSGPRPELALGVPDQSSVFRGSTDATRIVVVGGTFSAEGFVTGDAVVGPEISPRMVAVPTMRCGTTKLLVERRSPPSVLVRIRTPLAIAHRPILHSSSDIWDCIALHESGGNWASQEGGYEGGLDFLHSTWVAAGGRRYAEHAYQATREQQIAIAQSWLEKTSWEQWPNTSRICGVR